MEVEQYKNNEVALHEQLAKLVTHAEKSMADKTALEKVVSLWNCHIRYNKRPYKLYALIVYYVNSTMIFFNEPF